MRLASTYAFCAATLLLAVPGFALTVNPAFQISGSSASAALQSQSAATEGNLTIGVYDSTGQQAILFDNTSPPINPNGLGPVGAGATATLTPSSGSLLVDVINMDPTGFPLGFGNTSTEYTDFGSTFGFFVQNGAQTFFTDTTLNSDKLQHVRVTQTNNNFTLLFSATGNGAFDDAVVTGSGIAGVPEPASLLLLPLAVAGLALRKKIHRANGIAS